ncbi:MAG TPA: SIMPL domain-containing protein [Gammaproteobacteria bacterium]|nr:SIMPL domain-containing protein [Gammaproteobacteria bacterium]
MNFSLILSAIILSAGLIGAGYWGEQAVVQAKKADRFVTVKGLAEKNVKANLGVWEVDYQEVGNNLAQISTQLAQDQSTTMTFLLQNGFTKDEVSLRPTKVTDQLANSYNQANPQTQNNRYIIAGGIRIRSINVDQIQKVSQMTGDLIKQGVPLSFNSADYSSDLTTNPSYFYTQLDSIRPEMLASATQSAKLVAVQFANDSGSKLETIRRANQGVFELRSQDSSGTNSGNETGSINKTVRLVTTIDYYLVR